MPEFIPKTRMHSSGMRTARLLTISQHVLGVCLPGGYLPGGVWPEGRGGVCLGGCLPRGCLPGGCLPREREGVSAQGVSARRCLARGKRGYLPRGVSAKRGVCPGGMSAQGGVYPRGCLPLVLGVVCIPACNGANIPPCGQTDTCENITSITSFEGDKDTLAHTGLWSVSSLSLN